MDLKTLVNLSPTPRPHNNALTVTLTAELRRLVIGDNGRFQLILEGEHGELSVRQQLAALLLELQGSELNVTLRDQ